MKIYIGAGMVVLGVCLGIYIGFWVCFVGGIVDVIQAIRAPSLLVLQVGIGVGKVMFAGFFGWLSGMLLVIPGAVMAGFHKN